MNLKEGDVQKSKKNSSEKNRTIQATQKNKTMPFYRKSFLKNNKSYYYHKKGNNSNITPNNKSSLISGYKKPQKILNIGTEDTNQCTKGKSLICSKSKSNYDEVTPEKYILNNKTISPFSIHSIENSKDSKFSPKILNDKNKKSCIVKKNYNRKRENLSLNYPSKIHNISINNEEIKRNLKYDESLSNNSSKSKSKKYNFRPNKMKIFHNKEKKSINISYKSNKNEEQINLLSQNIVQNIQNSLNKYNNYNNTNTIIINNTIKRNNSNFLKPSKSNKAQLKINNNVFDINNIQTETTKRNLVKGKIIKFKYNGTEFFFEPIHNKTDNFFYKSNKSYTKKELILSSNLIKKWWRQITLLNILKIKNKIKSGINLISSIYVNRNFRLIKYKILYLNEITYIQKQWREYLYLKSRKEKTSVYRKNENYLYDNSYRKKYDNIYINSSEYTKSNEDISGYNFKNKIYYKNNKLKKKTKYLNNFFVANLSSSKLLSPKNNASENIPIKKTLNKNICFYSKYNCDNLSNKIIFIQRKIKEFLKFKYYSFIKKIYSSIYLNKISSYQNDINEKINREKNQFKFLNIVNNSFCIISNKKDIQKQLNIIKTKEIIFNKSIPYQKYKNQNLFVNKNSQLVYKPLKIKKKDNYTIFNNQSISIYSKVNKFQKLINEINFSIFKPNKKNQELNKIINKPIINNHCFYQKINLAKRYINSLILLQNAFRKSQNIKKITPKKTALKNNCFISKLYKINITKYQKATKIQNILELTYIPNDEIFSKPINKINYVSKIIKKFPKLKRFYKLQKNNSFKTITQNDSNKNQLYFNNIDEFLQDKEGEKINDVTKYNTINNSHRKFGERNSNILNDTDEKKNENPIKIMNAQIHKSSINCNINNIKNLKTVKNSYIPNNSIKYVNIESLPSINSLKTNTENDLFSNIESNKLINNNKIANNITSVSIQTLTSNLSKNKFRENIKFIKRMTTEGNTIKKYPPEFDNDKNYFYTDNNNVIKFSFNNAEGIILGSSTEKRNTKNYFNLIRFINIRKIKIICYKLILFKNVKCFYIFIQMVINRIKKSINAFVFNNIFGKNTKNDFYKIIHKHISIYNKIEKDINIKTKYKNNELILLIKSNIFKNYLNNKFLFLSDEQEKNLIQKDIFISNDKDLINYFLLYFKYENKSLDNNYFNLIQFRLIKEPLYNMNIFSITKYMDILYNNIIHKNICKNCFCKNGESCSINCNCHIKQQNSINLINKIKNRITHYKSSNDSNKDNNSLLDEKNKINDRNIKITIKKVKRGNVLDTTKTRYDNSEQNSDSKNSNSNDIDVFQKLNTGVQSIINKVKINKAFKDFSLYKKKMMDRTCTEINGIKNQTKSYNEGLNNVKNHFTTPDKRSCSSYLIEKKLLNEKND